MKFIASNSDKIASLIKIKSDSIKVSRKATIIQQKYQIKKKPQSSGKQCKKYHLPASEKWWEHNVEKVLQNAEVKILWDFKIQTDKHLAHNKPDITVVEKTQVWLIDVAISEYSRIDQKEKGKDH